MTIIRNKIWRKIQSNFADLKINGLMTSLEEKVKLSFFAVPLVKHVLEEIISGATFSTRSAKTASTKITLERL